jgi:hypothetical protein
MVILKLMLLIRIFNNLNKNIIQTALREVKVKKFLIKS